MSKVRKTLGISLSFMILLSLVFCLPNNVSAASRKPTKMTLNVSKKTIDVNQTYKIKVKSVSPRRSSKSVSYKSSNTRIATVSSSGTVKGKREGKVKITVQSRKNRRLKKTVNITVKRLKPYSLKLSKSNLNLSIFDTYKLKYSVNGNNSVVFSSGNKSVATIDKYGKITARKDGSSIITVKTVKNSYNGKPLVKTCKVNVSHFHEYKLINTENATCEKDGYTEYSCSICGNKYKQKISATGHNYELTYAGTATCNKTDYNVYTCENCGKTYKEELPKVEHEYSLISRQDADCEHAGLETYQCRICKETKTKTLPATGHNYKLIEEKDATEKEDGYKKYRCEKCKKEYTDVVKKEEHEWTQTAYTKPTCERDGYKLYVCYHCKQGKKETINKLGHDYVKIEHKDSSCGVQGYDVYKCSRCEKIDKRLLPFTDHELVKQKEDMKYIYYKCSRCGEDIKKYNDREYNIDLGNGKSTKVVGHYDLEMPKEILKLCNENRKIFELAPMTLVSDNDPLQEAANIRAVELAYFYNTDHLRPNGTKTLNSPEFNYININNENICLAKDAADACEKWFRSPDHHKAIINGSNSRIGIAVFCEKMEDGTYSRPYSNSFVQLFKS